MSAPELIYCECIQCDWRGAIDDTWMDIETEEMQCPKCKSPVEIEGMNSSEQGG